MGRISRARNRRNDSLNSERQHLRNDNRVRKGIEQGASRDMRDDGVLDSGVTAGQGIWGLVRREFVGILVEVWENDIGEVSVGLEKGGEA
jgi:hypothetical protein